MAWNLFVCGCGRSGTTAMWRLLSQSPEIVIGMERFIHKMMWGELTPDLYTEERFFTQGERETWYDITKGEEGAYMPLARERIGDKIPTLENHWDQVMRFQGGRIIYMVRNTQSHRGRTAEDPKLRRLRRLREDHGRPSRHEMAASLEEDGGQLNPARQPLNSRRPSATSHRRRWPQARTR